MPENKKKFIMYFDDIEMNDLVNWASFVPMIKRHSVYMSRFVEYSEQKMVLVGKAKNYADDEYIVDGIAASVDVKFKELNPSTLEYDTIFSLGKLSFKPGHYSRSRDKTEVSFQPVEFIGNFLARDEVTTELQSLVNMDGGAITTFTNETITVDFDNYELKKTVEYNDKSFSSISDTNDTDTWYLPVFLTEKESGSNEVVTNPFVDESLYINGSRNTVPDNNILISFDGDLGVYLSVYFLYTIDNAAPNYVNGTITIEYQLNADTPVVLATTTYNPASAITSVTDNISYNSTFTLLGVSSGDTLKIYLKYDPLTDYDQIDFTNFDLGETGRGSLFPEIAFQCNTQFVNTDLKGMLAWEYVLRCCQKITGRNDCLRSSYLGRYDGEVYQYGTTSADDGDGAYMFYSNVYQLRGYPIADYPIKASLRQAFKNVNTTGLVGLGIVYETVMGVSTPFISIEKLEDFYDASTVVMTLNAQDPGISWEGAIEYTWSTVKSGYKNFEEDETGTLGTIWGTREYTIAGIDSELSAVYDVESEMITSIELIEALRRKRYDANATKDEAYNRKTIALLVKRSGSNWVRVKNENFTSTNGINNPSTASNIDISPARVTAAHAPLLLCALANRFESTPATVSFLKFQSGEGNYDADTTISGEPTIYEDGNIDIDDLPAALDEPLFNANEMGTFTAKVDKSQRDSFRNGFNGVIAVVDNGTTYYGFPEEYRLIDLEKPTAEIKFVKRITP